MDFAHRVMHRGVCIWTIAGSLSISVLLWGGASGVLQTWSPAAEVSARVERGCPMILAKRRKARNGAHEQEFQEFKHHARKPAQQERARPQRSYTGERHGYTRGAQRFVYRAPY